MHLSKDLLDLIKAIGDSKSKQEEDKIMSNECETLKTKISQSGSTPKQKKEFLIRAIYCEMLGHDASFSHLHAVNLTQDKNILNKRVGYLACSLLLNENSEFLILLVASLQKDLQSSNWVEVSMALTTVIKFANPIIMQAVTEPILKLLDDRNEKIRKKAVMCLFKFYQVDPNSVPDCEQKMRKLLCDKDPSVMAATLPYFKEQSLKNPEKYKNLVTPFIQILKQVIEHKLPKEFNYHRFPAPWIQIILLEILSILGRDDQNSSENMYEIIGMCLRRADEIGINIGYATVYQCVKTICTIYPNSHLIELASNTISRFLSSDSPNLRCTGINGLTLIIQINPSYVMTHQKIIVDCLEVNDETLKKNTFELLYKMTNLKNVEVIVDKMMNYLKHTTLENQSKKDILQKITELTERFAPNKTWFIKVMNELFVNFGDMINDEILSKLIGIISEWEKESDDISEFKKYTIENYATIVENYSVLSDSFVKLMAWVIGEYTNKLYMGDSEKIKGILQMLSYLLNKTYDDEMTKCFLISAISKIHSNMNYMQLSFVSDIMERYSRDKNVELQQRCLEYKRTQARNAIIEKNDISDFNNELDFNLSFLDNYTQSKNNGKIYDAEASELFAEKFSGTDEKLNVGPYATSSTLFSMPSKGNNINKLYESKDDNLVTNMKNELSVKGAQKWGAEGYKEDIKKVPEKPSFMNLEGISSNSGKMNNSSNGLPLGFQGISNKDVKYNSGSSNYGSSSNNNASKKKNLEDDPNIQEKKKLMKGLFGGMDDDEEDTSSKNKKSKKKENVSNNNMGFNNSNNNNNNNQGMNLFDGLTQNKSGNTNNNNNQFNNTNNNNNNQQSGNVDLLGFDIGGSSNDNNMMQNNNMQNNNNNQGGGVDLLGDIFGGGGMSSNNNMNTNNNMNNNNNNTFSLFDNLNNNNSNNNNLNNNMNFNNNNNNSNNLFENLASPQQASAISNMDFTPLNINTDQFGEMWENSPEEDAFEIHTNIQTPQQYHDIIKSKGNFAAVDIINNEAISSAKYKNQFVLVHATIEPGDINLLVKCQNKAYNNEIATFVISLFN